MAQAIFMQKISPLASKLREPLKVADRQIKFLPAPIGKGMDGQKFKTLWLNKLAFVQ